MQSMPKPFMYGLALEGLGDDAVLQHVGVEPTGDAFNSIVLDRRTHRSGNLIVNAGALVLTTLQNAL
ncbi:glutaminase [Deinococcus arboris]